MSFIVCHSNSRRSVQPEPNGKRGETKWPPPVFVVQDMNPKSKRPKLNSAFKSVQRLPWLLPKTHARRPISESPDRQPVPSQAAASFTPPPGAPGLQSLAE